MKTCIKCGESKSLDEFYPNGYKKNGERAYRPRCRACEGQTKPKQKKAIERDGKRQCVVCLEFKELSYFEGNRSKCHSCRNEARWNGKDPILRKCYEMAGSAHARVLAPSREHKTIYRDLQEPFGFVSIKAMAEYLYREFYDDIKGLMDNAMVPSVDRIDSEIGYTPSNIRIMEFTKNTLRGVSKRKRKVRVVSPDGEEIIFPSIVECAKHFGTLESHVRVWLKGKYRPRNGHTFTYYVSA